MTARREAYACNGDAMAEVALYTFDGVLCVRVVCGVVGVGGGGPVGMLYNVSQAWVTFSSSRLALSPTNLGTHCCNASHASLGHNQMTSITGGMLHCYSVH